MLRLSADIRFPQDADIEFDPPNETAEYELPPIFEARGKTGAFLFSSSVLLASRTLCCCIVISRRGARMLPLLSRSARRFAPAFLSQTPILPPFLGIFSSKTHTLQGQFRRVHRFNQRRGPRPLTFRMFEETGFDGA